MKVNIVIAILILFIIVKRLHFIEVNTYLLSIVKFHYKGNNWEKDRVATSFNKLIRHQVNVMTKKLYMGTFDSMLVKYGAVMVGYAILGLPVFGPGSKEYL